MPVILSIETATNVCSVALSGDGKLLSLRESILKNAHSSVLTKFIEEVFQTAGLSLHEVDAIAVSEGPGSYTGLRIGIATAKGLCYALDKPLIAVSTLKAMASGMLASSLVTRHSSPVTFLCPMIDARRMEVFTAVYNSNLGEIYEPSAEIITESSFSELLKGHNIVFAGDGAEKCKPYLSVHENAIFQEDFHNSAKHMIQLATGQFLTGNFENIAYFEPRYLKEFMAGKTRVKGLN